MAAKPASAETAYAVTESGKLAYIDTSRPWEVVQGLIAGTEGLEPIVSVDFRPLDGRLYGVSRTRLYKIDVLTFQASRVSNTAFPAPLSGNVDMDFDPVSGLIRVVTEAGQNLRINPDTAAVTTDTPISGVASVSAAAFTNNFASPDRATLYGLSFANDHLVRIGGADPDGGASQAAGVATSIGTGLTLTLGDAPMGFDIAANDNEAFAVLAPGADTESSLYRINLQTGVATLVRQLALGERVRGLALVTRAVKLYALASPTPGAPAGGIATVLSAVPGTLLPQPSGTIVPITGLAASEEVVDIETRFQGGELVGLTNTGKLVNIDPVTGKTSQPKVLGPLVQGTIRAFAYDRVNDEYRIIGANGLNLSVTAAGVVTQNMTLDTSNVIAAAYDGVGALYAITSDNTLVRFDDPVIGISQVITAVPSIFGPSTALTASPSDDTLFIAQDDDASSAMGLYSLSRPDGGLSNLIGQFPASAAGYRGLAVASPGRVRFNDPASSVREGSLGAITLVREGGSSGPITVRLGASDMTAIAFEDYIDFSATIEFADGEVTKVLFPFIIDDTLDEPDEMLRLTLSDPALGAILGVPNEQDLTIIDNDPVNGAPPTILIQTPTADPLFAASSTFITLAGIATDTDGTIVSVTWTSDRGVSGTASTGGAAASVDWYATDVRLAPGANTITVTATDNSGNVSTDTLVVTVNDLAYYLAEGATGSFFDLDLLIANPNDSAVEIVATFLKPLGQGTVTRQYTLAPFSRTTINVESIPGLENAEVSTIVTAPAISPIIVERTMRWNESGYGAHTDKASSGTSRTWYFAEGSQGFFFTYLLLANPHNAANTATVKYLRENNTAITRSYELDPLERFTVDIGADSELVNQSFGMLVTFALPGIAERAMYFGLNPLWIGGHESMGVTLPSRNWFLAEGATGSFFETFVLLANPGQTLAHAAVRFLPDSGAPVDKTYDVPAGERVTINIQGEAPSLANAAVATQVTSDVPIVVERAQYWPDPPQNWYEAHNSFGVTSTGTKWGLAEGRVGLNAGYQTYILLANPNTEEALVSITFLRESGAPLVKTFTVSPASRFNVAVGGADVPEITNETFGAMITASHPIAVERAMYSDQAGVTWQAGTNATGTRLP